MASTAAEELCIEMLGAGQEVGRSCCVIKYKGKTVVCDAGVHPAYQGIAALPFIDELDWSTVDALLITHFHLDHAAALTYVMEKTNFRDGKGKVYMTHPTKAVYRFLMSDFVRISNAGSDDQLFDESEMLTSWRQIEAVDFHQDVSVGGGLRFTPYHAGHVLGACMFMIELAGLRILYTGDFSREEDRHLVQAEIPPIRPDVLISESTYGMQSHPPRLDKEERFTTTVRKIVQRGGRVLLPVFVLGRAQELLLLLDEYWAAHPELHSIPIYYASSLARKCIGVYQTYIHTMNDHIRSRFNRRDNPFVFKHISNLRSLDRFEDKGPCVMMASPGFMQSGVSRELLERWAPDRRNGLIVTGYSVEGTMARNILTEPEEITALNGQKIPLRMSVDYISFSAHVDYTQNSRFIEEIKPQHIVLVHGEQFTMGRLRAALQSTFAARGEETKVHTPRNCEPLRIKFRGERVAKAIGTIAAKPPAPDSILSGLLVSKDFAYTILDPKDLADFTGLSTSTIVQRQRVALRVGWALVRWHLEGMYGRVEEGVDLEGRPTLRIMNAVDVKQSEHSRHELLLEWVSSAATDMIADAAVALLLGIDSSPASVRLTTRPHRHSHGEVGKGDTPDSKQRDDDGEDMALDAHPSADPRVPADADLQSAARLRRIETLAAFLEAHFGHVEEIVVGEEQRAPEAEQDRQQGSEGARKQEVDETGHQEEATNEIKVKQEPGVEETSAAGVVPAAPADSEGKQAEDTPMKGVESDAKGGASALQAAPAKTDTQDQPRANGDPPTGPRKGGRRRANGRGASAAQRAASASNPLEGIEGPARPALKVTLDQHVAAIEVESLAVHSSSVPLGSRLSRLAALALQTCTSLADSFRVAPALEQPLFQGGHGAGAGEGGAGAAGPDDGPGVQTEGDDGGASGKRLKTEVKAEA